MFDDEKQFDGVGGRGGRARGDAPLKGLSHEIDFKNFDKNLQNLA
jgi:hypothetical protein